MILVIAIAVGLAVGFIRAKLIHVPYQPLELKGMGLLICAAFPQFLAFFLPATRQRIPETWIPFILIGTQLLLLVFVWINRDAPFVWLLGMGLVLNLAVISFNGGWMPISPKVLNAEGVPTSGWQIGSRLGFTKNKVFSQVSTPLWIFSDILTLPSWFPYRVAFSIGDVLIAFGVIGFLYQNKDSRRIEVINKEKLVS